MAESQIAWVTHAPADYMLVFVENEAGEHAVVCARFETEDALVSAGRDLPGGGEISDGELRVYCTLPGEAEGTLAHVRDAGARATRVEQGSIAFVAVGDGSATSPEAADRRRNKSARIVLSLAGDAPRCYVLEGQCRVCGELRGRTVVMPQGAMLLDTRELHCRCRSIACRYCEDGKVRRPLTEHFDPERRSGCVPWFGYLVPCGDCQAAGRGPRVQMST